MEKLFAIIVGGYPPGAHVEVHDVRFVVGRELTDCMPALKEQWWGGEDRFHIDAWGAITWADGYDVVLSPSSAAGPHNADPDHHLWFVNLGGYRAGVFDELHENVFVAAQDAAEAKRKALKMAKSLDWTTPHRDAQMTVESSINIAGALGGDWSVHLVPNPQPRPFLFEARYLKIG